MSVVKIHFFQDSGLYSLKLWQLCTMQREVSKNSGLLMLSKLAVYPVFLPR